MGDVTAEPGGEGEPARTLESLTGPFYDVVGLTTWLGLSPADILAQVDEQELLGVSTGDGTLVFPLWQFTEHR